MRKYFIFLLIFSLLLIGSTAYADQVTTRQLQKLELCIIFDNQPDTTAVNGVQIKFETPKYALSSESEYFRDNSFHDGKNYLGVVGTLISITNNSPYPAMINWLDSAIFYGGNKLGIPFVDKMTYEDYERPPGALYTEVAPGQKVFISVSIPPVRTSTGWLQVPVVMPKDGSVAFGYLISVKVKGEVAYARLSSPGMYIPRATYEYLLADEESNY